jgi:hypothetical protein
VTSEMKRIEHLQHILTKLHSILADGARQLDPGADPEYDTNDLYGLVTEGIEARKKLAACGEALRSIAFHVPIVCYEHDERRYVDIEEVFVLKRIAADVR